jgi:hypothetical protein
MGHVARRATRGRRDRQRGAPRESPRPPERPAHADALRSLEAIYLDAGTRDEWFFDFGAEAFRRELEAIGVTDVRFELSTRATSGSTTAIRSPSLAYLAERLSPAG